MTAVFLAYSPSSKLMSWFGQAWVPRLSLKYTRRLAPPHPLRLHQIAFTIIAFVNSSKNLIRSAHFAQLIPPPRVPAPALHCQHLCLIATILHPRSPRPAPALSHRQLLLLLLLARQQAQAGIICEFFSAARS